MFSKRNLSSSLLALSSLILAGSTSPVTNPLVERQDACPAGSGIVQVYITENTVTFPIVINQYFEDNTVINIGGITININNAPTSLSTSTQGTSTVTVTSTASTTITATPAPVPAGAFFLLGVTGAGAVVKRQLQGNGFVGPSGNTVDGCSGAALFSISNGELSSQGELFSTSGNVSSQAFVPSGIVSSITTEFTEDGGLLEWDNAAFTGGRATFCSFSNGNIDAVFSTAPDGCIGVTLEVIPVSECFGANTTSSASSSSSSSSSTSASLPATNTTTSAPFPAMNSTTTSPSGSGTVPTATSAPFLVQVVNPNTAVTKRQSAGSFIGVGGVLSTDCTNGVAFQVSSGSLIANTGTVSTNSGSTSAIFSGEGTLGDISTTFSLSGTLITWTNMEFVGGIATFVVTTEGVVEAIFNDQLPADSTQVILEAFAVTSCNGLNNSTTTSPTGPSGTSPVVSPTTSPTTTTTPSTNPVTNPSGAIPSGVAQPTGTAANGIVPAVQTCVSALTVADLEDCIDAGDVIPAALQPCVNELSSGTSDQVLSCLSAVPSLVPSIPLASVIPSVPLASVIPSVPLTSVIPSVPLTTLLPTTSLPVTV
ncbi:MAG: hypothetical protein M1827_005244 [Pycnora praestabilis]|nr:MAG: hypothetical protein M1827_005244 [Pycnora praestabilis]